jgi:Flp pilus assembly protein CpaB
MTKLLLPAGLGLAAFVMNFVMAGNSRGPAAVQLAAAATEIKAGEKITEEMLEAVSAPGGSAVGKSAVPYAERGVLAVGQVARRKIPKGELVLFDDVRVEATELQDAALSPGEAAVQVPLDNIKCPSGLVQLNAQVGFLVVDRAPANLELAAKFKPQPPKILGPYRVVSVGGKANTLSNSAPENGNPPVAIGVAVKPGPDGKLEGKDAEFLQLLSHTPGQEGNGIAAIVLFPSRKDG